MLLPGVTRRTFCMTTPTAVPATDHPPVGWPVAGLLLDALAHRDFATLVSCLAPDVRFRALVPPGPFELAGSAETARRFEKWFGGTDDFELVDRSIGQVRDRLYLRWRVQMRSARDPGDVRVAEQHVFATAADRITAMDLLCSGFRTGDVS